MVAHKYWILGLCVELILFSVSIILGINKLLLYVANFLMESVVISHSLIKEL